MLLQRKYLIPILTALIILFAGLNYKLTSKKSSSELPIIAVTQIIDHFTLDQVRQGMIKELADHGYVDGNNIRIIYENANGNMSLAAQISNHFVKMHPKVIIALSTPSAQMLMQPSQAAKIPLIFTAV